MHKTTINAISHASKLLFGLSCTTALSLIAGIVPDTLAPRMVLETSITADEILVTAGNGSGFVKPDMLNEML